MKQKNSRKRDRFHTGIVLIGDSLEPSNGTDVASVSTIGETIVVSRQRFESECFDFIGVIDIGGGPDLIGRDKLGRREGARSVGQGDLVFETDWTGIFGSWDWVGPEDDRVGHCD